MEIPPAYLPQSKLGGSHLPRGPLSLSRLKQSLIFRSNLGGEIGFISRSGEGGGGGERGIEIDDVTYPERPAAAASPIRALPSMTSAKILDFLTPSSLVGIWN